MEFILLTLGFVGVLVALLTKYGLLSGAVSIFSFATYFYLIGTSQWIYVLMLFLGITLIVLEIFIPSFGVVGIIGGTLTVLGVLLSSQNMVGTLVNLSMAILLTLIVCVILLKNGFRLHMGHKFVLNTRLSNEKGFRSFDVDYHKYLHQKGETLTALRPVGRAKIDDDELEVLSGSEMIDAHMRIVVYKVEGNKVFVRREG